jgi:hypothetical protein
MSYAHHPDPSPPEATWTRDDWNTPAYILDPIHKFAGGKIGLDPCSNDTSLVLSAHSFTKEDNSLTREWGGYGLVFINPPYSRGLYEAFAQKITVEGCNGTELIAIPPTNCETKAWKNGFWKADAICFLNKRVRFLKEGKPKGSPAGGNALVYFGPRNIEFGLLFSALGKVIYPSVVPYGYDVDGGDGPGSPPIKRK